MYKQCHNEIEWSCDVIRNINSKKEKVYGGVKSLDAQRNCLIETDSEQNKITAHQLNSKQRHTLISTQHHSFENVPILDIAQYTVFQGSSYFDQNGNLILLADEIDNQKKFKKIFPNPCRL